MQIRRRFKSISLYAFAYENIRPCTDEEQNQMLDAWKKGQTGYPLRCMYSFPTSYRVVELSNASYDCFTACYNLWIDWRMIKDWLARQFTIMNQVHICQQNASRCDGINSIRVYNLKQAKSKILRGIFIRGGFQVRDVPKGIHRPYQIPPLMEMMNPMNRHGYPNEIVH